MTLPYSITAKGSAIRERIAYVIESQTPELAPEIPFTRLTAADFQDVPRTTQGGRVRSFRVKVEQMAYGSNPWGESKNNYDVLFTVEMGYPAEAFYRLNESTTDPTKIYEVDDLRVHDFEQIDDVLQALAPFTALDATHPAIDDVNSIELVGPVTYNGLVQAWRYTINYYRTR